MKLLLKINDLWKSYNGQEVLKGCSYSFVQGGVHALMGSNGSGKSTLLRICALLEKPDKGTVSYLSAGESLAENISLRRRVTLVLPEIGVFNASVFANVAYGLKIRGAGKAEIKERVGAVLEFVRLSNKIEQNALTLSSGETQRLGIARAIVIEPEIMFLDEPTASVDEENTRIIENIILEMKDRNITIILTTHDLLQAKRISDKLIVVKEGKLLSKLID
jgi:tungstate transport system ATP-binding protein